MFMPVLTISLGVFLGLLAFAVLAGIVAVGLLLFGLIGNHRESERQIRESDARRMAG
jgi:hypothetical protein